MTMVQTTELTHKQKVKMYKKLKKRELIEMLIAANEVIESMQPTTVYKLPSTGNIPCKGVEIICSCTEPNHGL
jgi:hypothetical protein